MSSLGNGDPVNEVHYVHLFDAIQTLVVGGIKKLLPPDFDFEPFQAICDKKVNTRLQYGWVIYDLLNHFIRALGDNIVCMYDYRLLETQTQKLQAEVRSHIKLEQEIKLYIDSKSRAAERHKQQYKQLKRYAYVLEDKLKEHQRPVRSHTLERNKSTTINLNLFKTLLGTDPQPKQPSSPGKPNLNISLNRNDFQRSNCLQSYLSPRLQPRQQQKIWLI